MCKTKQKLILGTLLSSKVTDISSTNETQKGRKLLKIGTDIL